MMTTVPENLFELMLGRATIEAIYLLRRLVENYREKRDIFSLHKLRKNI